MTNNAETIKNLLFVCSAGEVRSRTAAELMADPDKFKTEFAGVRSTARPVSQSLIDWADMIFVFDEKSERQLSLLQERFDLKDKPIHLLDIPSRFGYQDPELRSEIEQKIKPILS